MRQRKFLTKSNFKTGLSCPRKLFYVGKHSEYADNRIEDTFLQALAQGGYQVGELAKVQYETGIEITERAHELAAEKTNELLEQKECIIFEAAFLAPPFYVRADIVIKKGNDLKLIEVKSKSIDPQSFREDIWNSRAGKGVLKLKSAWTDYIYDLAFQTWVARMAHPGLNITAHFKAADKTKKASVDGLNTLFLIQKNGSSFTVERQKNITKAMLGENLLPEIDLTDIVNDIIDGKEKTEFLIKKPFSDLARELAGIYTANTPYPATKAITSQCKHCEFRDKSENLKSGFEECWGESQKIESHQVDGPFVFDLGRFTRTNDLFAEGTYLLQDLETDDINESKDNGKTGFKQSDRQKLQLEAVKAQIPTPTVRHEELHSEYLRWNFPFHFIDFETCAPAIPFNAGLAPRL